MNGILQSLGERVNIKSVVVIAAAVLAWWLGGFIARASLSSLDVLRYSIGALVVLVFVAVLVWGKRALQVAFGVWVLMFVLGYRNFHLTDTLQFHPSEILIWFLALVLVVQKSLARETTVVRFPLALTLFLLLGVVGVFTALSYGKSWDSVVGEAKILYVIVPVWVVVREFVATRKRWSQILGLFIVSQFYIGLLGSIEYFFPQFTRQFTPYFTPNQTALSIEGFTRASFSFWGNGIIVGNLLTALPLCLAWAEESTSRRGRYFALSALAVCLIGIYISGYRVAWLGAFLVLMLYFLLRPSRSNVFGLVATLFGSGILFLLGPEDFTNRIQRFVSFDPQLIDSSTASRAELISSGLAALQQGSLFGYGWGAAGWIHNDYLQIAVNLGFVAALLFFGWIVATSLRLWAISHDHPKDSLGLWAHASMTALFGYLIVFGAGDIVFVLPMIFQFCFVVALAALVAFPPRGQSPESHFLLPSPEDQPGLRPPALGGIM